MPIFVHVKHYLTESGFTFFDGWFLRVHKYMSQKTGFQSLEYAKYPSDSIIHIVLAFENIEKLEAWIKEPVHDKLVDELDAYRSRNIWHAARTQDPEADWKTLPYQEICAKSAL